MSLLEVVVPAPSYALTTRDRVRAATSIALDDALLDIRIGQASARIERLCGRVFAQERVRETIVTDSPMSVILQRTPLVQLLGVSTGSAYGSPPSLLDSTLFRIADAGAGLVQLTLAPTMAVLSEYGSGDYGPRRRATVSVVVDYVGGYGLPGWPDPVPPPLLPVDLEAALFDLIAGSATQSTIDQPIASVRLGDAQINYVTAGASSTASSAGMPARVTETVAAYRRLVLA